VAASFIVDLLIRPQSNSTNHASLEIEEKEIPMSDTKPVVIVTGVGPGTGAAIVRRFAHGGYAVAMLARNRDRLTMLEREISGAHAYQCDVTDEAKLDATIEAVRAGLGVPKVLIHNAVGGAFGNFMQIDPEILNRNFQVNTMALLHLARRLAPAMVAAGEGAIVASGNTSALRGKAGFAGFAPTKAAQRILAESIAREVGPKGVHVAYVLIDAVIDLEWTRKRWPDAPDAFFIKPAAIAEEIWHVAHQDRSAWSFNVEIRPFGETW
jgi:NAD(P)-dependent dehydrogenase (short-subunit alcohol dehydrogenase family)